MKSKILALVLVTFLLGSCGGTKNQPVDPGNTPSDPSDPDAPVDPDKSNGVFERVFNAAKRYNTTLTLEKFKQDTGLEPSKTTDYSYLFRLIYHGFKDVMPPLKGMRRYTGDWNNYPHSQMSGDEALGYGLLKDHGLIAEMYKGSNGASVSDADKMLRRIYAYIGTNEKDDFAIANNYDWCIEHDEFDGKTSTDNIMKNNLVNSDAIITNAMEFSKEAATTDKYADLSNIYNFYASDEQFVPSTNSTLLNDYTAMNELTSSRSSFMEYCKNELDDTSYSGLLSFEASKVFPTHDNVFGVFTNDYSGLFYDAIEEANYSTFINKHSQKVAQYTNKVMTYFGLSPTQASGIEGDFKNFLQVCINKYNAGDGGSYTYVLDSYFFLDDDDPINKADSSYTLNGIAGNYPLNYCLTRGYNLMLMNFLVTMAGNVNHFDYVRAYLIYDYVAKYTEGIESLITRSNDLYLVHMMGYNLTSYYQSTNRYVIERDKIAGLFNDLIGALKDNATANGWLTSNGVEALKNKANKVKHSLFAEYDGVDYAYGDYLDNDFTTDMMRNIKIYSKNRAEVYCYFIDKEIEGTYSTRQSAYLLMQPFTANAFYMGATNSIYITMGYNFSKNPIQSMSEEELLATYGLVMGHEITHGFDSNGCYYDANGYYAPNSIFPMDDLISFEAKQEEVIKLYTYELMPGVMQSGQVTLSEDLADIGGLGVSTKVAKGKENFDYQTYFHYLAKNFFTKVSYNAYYSRELNKDVHALGRARLNPLLMSNKLFLETFDIKEGDGMYRDPAKAIVIW